MKQHEVKVGETYIAKVSDKLTKVRIDDVSPHGGWVATNLATGKRIRIKSPMRLRAAASAKEKGKGKAKGQTSAEAAPQAASEAAPAQESAASTQEAPKTRKKAERADGTTSGLDAAAKVLAEAGEALTCRAITEQAISKGYWKSGGKTPHATVYSAILREIQHKGDQSRFRKAERGKFVIAS